MGRDSSAHNHLFLIAQTQKIGILQVAVSKEDSCDQNSKQSTPLSHAAYRLPFLPYPSSSFKRTHLPMCTHMPMCTGSVEAAVRRRSENSQENTSVGVKL